MDNVNNNTNANTNGNQSQNSLNIKQLFFLCINSWYLFALSVIVMGALAYLYLASTSPTYKASACLVIKQDRRTGGSGLETSSMNFSNMGSLFSSQTNVYNEILAFQSPALMTDVVRNLDLRANYTTKSKLYEKTLYGPSLPITVKPQEVSENASFSLTVTYVNDSTVQVSHMGTTIAGEPVVFEEPVTAYFGKVTDTPVGKLVIEPTILFYDSNKAFTPIKYSYSSLISASSRYNSLLSVALTNKEATAISLSITDKSAVRAKDVLAEVINQYNQKWVDDRNQISVSTSEFINDRLIVIEKELGNVDSNLSDFKSRNSIIDPLATANMYLTQSTQLEKDMLELNNRLSVARFFKDYLSSPENKNRLLPANSGIENSGIESQISEFNKIQLSRNNMLANSSMTNPIIVDMDADLAAMRKSIDESIDTYIFTLKKRIASLQSTGAKTQNMITSSPKQVEHLTDIERQQKVKESLYLYLLQKREENELSQAFTAYNTRILTPPYTGASPISPIPNRIYLIALLIGLAIPAGILFIQQNLDTKLRTRKELENLNIPLVATIPLCLSKEDVKWQKAARILRLPVVRVKPKKNAPIKKKLVVQPKNRDVINEAFRVARANIEFICERTKESGIVVQTTSFNVGSGKTFFTCNMAVALAIKGKKVCAVDLDLRKSTISEYVDSPSKGVTQYLSGKVSDLDTLLVKGSIVENLDFLPAGSIPPNPTELLYTPKMKELMELLKSKYDYVFLDCPPVEIVADPLIINQYTDHTFFVVRSGVLDRELLPTIDVYYNTNKYNGMMLVFNGAEFDARSGYKHYGKGYGYGYGYNKGYGYGDAYSSKPAYGSAKAEDEDEKKA